MIPLSGVFSVLPTPFSSGGEVDLPSLRRVIDLCIGAGVDGLTVLGVTGEAARLTDRERQQVLEETVAHAGGRLPVVAGTSAGGTAPCVDYSRSAGRAGAAAVMVSSPRMPRLNSAAVLRHFQSLAEQVELPIIIQDYPPVSGFPMEAPLLARIAREIPAARTIKMEDPPTPFKIARILEAMEGIPVSIFGGLGGVYLLEELQAGAAGAMTGFAFPELLVDIVRKYRAGDTAGAADAFYRNVALMRFEFQEGIGVAIRKEIYRRRGALECAAIRPPGTPLDQSTLEALNRILDWFHL